jgi:choline dehydrogenase-like flavoprotein
MNETYDFIVVGSGGGAFCAALVLRAAGKSVLILEKTPLLGGTTATSGGVLWIPNNRYMKAAGIADSAEAANAYLDAVIGEPVAKGRWIVRVYHEPLVAWIWFGALIMVAGGLTSLSDRRYRVGAPVRAGAAQAAKA